MFGDKVTTSFVSGVNIKFIENTSPYQPIIPQIQRIPKRTFFNIYNKRTQYKIYGSYYTRKSRFSNCFMRVFNMKYRNLPRKRIYDIF